MRSLLSTTVSDLLHFQTTVLGSCETFERETAVSQVNEKTMTPISASFTLQTKEERCRLRLFKNVNITMPFRIL